MNKLNDKRRQKQHEWDRMSELIEKIENLEKENINILTKLKYLEKLLSNEIENYSEKLEELMKNE